MNEWKGPNDLRDYIASETIKILLIQNTRPHHASRTVEALAEEAYRTADLFMKARNRAD